MIRISGSRSKYIEFNASDVLSFASRHDSEIQGCFTLDDGIASLTQETVQSALKNGTACAVKSITLPFSVDAFPFYPDGTWDGVCQGVPTEARLEGGRTHLFTTSPCAFKFVPRNAAGCSKRSDGLCLLELDVNVTNLGATANEALSLAQTASRTPCDYVACNPGIQNVLDTVFPTHHSSLASTPLQKLAARPCDYVDCVSGLRDVRNAVLRAVPWWVYGFIGLLSVYLATATTQHLIDLEKRRQSVR